MKHLFFVFVLSLFSMPVGWAQETAQVKKGYKYNNNFDLALASKGVHHSVALSWVKLHAFTKKENFKVGYGLRITSQFGKDLYYITAPAKLTIESKNIDTFFVKSPQNNAINLSLNLQYTLKEKIDLGFNIDAIGASFGKSTKGKYISNQSLLSGSEYSASPTKLNVLLVGDNDIGLLNSEFYLRYWFSSKLAIRAGASFLFTEYTSSTKLRLDNDRWRYKAMQGMLAISFSPFR